MGVIQVDWLVKLMDIQIPIEVENQTLVQTHQFDDVRFRL